MMIISRLNKEYLENHIEEFKSILMDIPEEYWNEKNFLTELRGKWNYSLVGTTNNKIVGYIIASDKGKNIHIHKFMVSADYRGNKIGTRLLKHFEDICKEKKKMIISLKVSNKNKNAIAFYTKNDFKITENVNSYHRMEKRIIR